MLILRVELKEKVRVEENLVNMGKVGTLKYHQSMEEGSRNQKRCENGEAYG